MPRKKSSQKVYKKDGRISNRVKEGLLAGVSRSKIFDSVSHYAACPGRTQFYKLYAEEFAEYQYNYSKWLGDKDKERIEAGSDKILELELRSRGDRNPSVKIEEVDSDAPDEDNDAMNILLEKLGKIEKDNSQ